MCRPKPSCRSVSDTFGISRVEHPLCTLVLSGVLIVVTVWTQGLVGSLNPWPRLLLTYGPMNTVLISLSGVLYRGGPFLMTMIVNLMPAHLVHEVVRCHQASRCVLLSVGFGARLVLLAPLSPLFTYWYFT